MKLINDEYRMSNNEFSNSDMVNTNNYLLKVDGLRTYFPIKKGLLRRTVGYVKAVDVRAAAARRPLPEV